MSTSIYEPLYEIEHLIGHALVSPQQQQRLFGEEDWGADSSVVRSFKPRMDLHEDKARNLVTATFDFPGVVKDDIRIDVQGGKLTVSAKTKQSTDHDENGYVVRERRFGRYSRTLELPQGVLENQIEVSMQNGVLTVTFPKTSAEQAPRRIAII